MPLVVRPTRRRYGRNRALFRRFSPASAASRRLARQLVAHRSCVRTDRVVRGPDGGWARHLVEGEGVHEVMVGLGLRSANRGVPGDTLAGSVALGLAVILVATASRHASAGLGIPLGLVLGSAHAS